MLATGYSVLTRKFLALTLPTLSIKPKYYGLIVAAATLAVGLVLAWFPLKAAALLVGGAIFFTLVLLRPTLILYALIPVIPFSSMLAISIGGARAGAMELLLALAAAIWLLKIITSQSVYKHPLKIYSGPLLWPFLIFLGGVGLTWLNTFSIRASLVETIKWVEMFILYLFIINLLPPRQIKWVALVIILTGTIQAALGLYQFVFKVGPEGFLLFGGDFLRAYGTFAQPNPYAGYLGLILPLALSLTIWAFETSPKTSAVVWGAYTPDPWNSLTGIAYFMVRLLVLSMPLVIMVAALFASQSRGAWLGFVGAGVVTVVVRSKKAAMVLFVLALVAALAVMLSSLNVTLSQKNSSEISQVYIEVTQRFVAAASIFEITDVATTPVTDANFATVERLAHWQAARDMWRDNVWMGVGFGNYAAIYPAYAVGRWLDPLGHAHNYPLNLGAEAGLVGIITYLIFWIFTFGVSLLAVRWSNGFFKAVAAGGAGILVHLHIHNMVDNLYVQGMYLHIAIILGMISVIYCYSRRYRVTHF